jgi:ATP-binding cassette, subfamily B, bacterial
MFPFVKQLDKMDCGPACISMVLKHYGINATIREIRSNTRTQRDGTSIKSICDALESYNLNCLPVKININILRTQAPLPTIIITNDNHFIIIYKITTRNIYVADPAFGLIKYSKPDFESLWQDENQNGIAILIEKAKRESEYNRDKANKTKKYDSHKNTLFLIDYLKDYKKEIIQLMLGVFTGIILNLLIPIITQNIIDEGIGAFNFHFITIMLLCQIFVFLGKVNLDLVRTFSISKISGHITLNIQSGLYKHILRLPISFFEEHMIGDIIQRVYDHEKIEDFLTGNSVNTVFSAINIIALLTIIIIININVFLITMLFIFLTVTWIIITGKKRKINEYKRVKQAGINQSEVIDVLHGMNDIKISNSEQLKYESLWYNSNKLSKLRFKIARISIIQIIISTFLNDIRTIIVTFICANMVINGTLSIGQMLAVSYIIAQINSPLIDIISFIQQFQDASISIERLTEIRKVAPEINSYQLIKYLPDNSDIVIKDLCFRYDKTRSNYQLNNVNLVIPHNKITSIVGSSGSGKTTLLKILLKLYSDYEGHISYGELPYSAIQNQDWRKKCGVVLQDGYIFSDTIENNIALGAESIDYEQLIRATQISNIYNFISEMPQKFKTKIGEEGMGISMGQKQRLLIARAIYNNPDFLFFDEATSSLDANNEREIMNNLNAIFVNKTVFIIAHRLSTVINSDQIIVLDNGQIIETGTHIELTKKRGAYFNLIRNQLELGK